MDLEGGQRQLYKTGRSNLPDHQQLAFFHPSFPIRHSFTRLFLEKHKIKMHFTAVSSIVAILGAAAANAAPSPAPAAEVKNSTSFLAPSLDKKQSDDGHLDMDQLPRYDRLLERVSGGL